MVADMDAAELTLTILHYTQHLAGIAANAQKTSNKTAWAMLQAQAEIKARTEEITGLKEQVAKKSPASDKTLSPLLERAQFEAEASRNQLAHVEAKVQDPAWLVRSYNQHYCLVNSEAEINRLQELLQKEKPGKQLISYD